MTAPRASVMAALLLLSVLGLPAEARTESSEGTAARAATSDSGDPTEGQLLALTPVASRFGVIVSITGTRVNIVRRDGTELRLRGVLPGEETLDHDGAVLLLQRGDAWVRPPDVPQLLGLADETRLAPRGAAITRALVRDSAFETFEVRKPRVARPPRQPRPSRQARPRRLPATEVEGGAGHVQTDVSAVEVGLGLSRVSTFATPAMSGVYQEVVGPGSSVVAGNPRQIGGPAPVDRTLSHLSVNASEGDRLLLLGDMSDPLFGPGTGFELRTPGPKGAWYGASVLAPVETVTEPGDARVALRAGTVTPGGFGGEVALSPDGSHLLTGEWRQRASSLRLSLVDRLHRQHRDLSWGYHLLPAVKAFGRHAKAAGEYEAETQLLGLDWQLGQARVGVEQQRGVSAGQAWTRDALSLSLLQRRTSLSLRYLLPHQEADRRGLEWFISRVGPSRRQFYFSSSAPASGSPRGGRTYRLGASTPVRKHLRSRIGVELSPDGIHPEGKLEWRRSTDAMVSLRYGLLDSESSGEALDRGLVLQASFAFGGNGRPPRGTGRIVGSVRDDAGRGVADVAVVVEEIAVAFTRADGSFEFEGVAAGRQRVKLDLDRLHADLGGRPPPRTVFVQRDAAERADFVVTRLCRVAGQVYLQSAPSETGEAVVGAVVELSDGQRATTNSEGSYSFDSLPPSRYTVSFASSTDASTLTPTSPTSWSFRLEPGDQVSGADFVFARRARPIVFDTVSE